MHDNRWGAVPCKGCGAPMIWMETKAGKRICVDAAACPCAYEGCGVAAQEHTGPGESHGPTQCPRFVPPRLYDHRRMASHWGTCPKRDQFRRRA